MRHSLLKPRTSKFDPASFLDQSGQGRSIVHWQAKQALFSQGAPADCVFYIQRGRAKLTVVSKIGKEAMIMILTAGDFVGEEAILAVPQLRTATATTINACTVLKITRDALLRVISEEPAFSSHFMGLLLARGMKTQADLVDHLFHSSERRLARVLLLMAESSGPDDPSILIPHITQEALGAMIGTTRSRVSFFMNKFRKLGCIEYNGRIRVHKALLKMTLDIM